MKCVKLLSCKIQVRPLQSNIILPLSWLSRALVVMKQKTMGGWDRFWIPWSSGIDRYVSSPGHEVCETQSDLNIRTESSGSWDGLEADWRGKNAPLPWQPAPFNFLRPLVFDWLHCLTSKCHDEVFSDVKLLYNSVMLCYHANCLCYSLSLCILH
jgi:hypothetical protein